MAPRPVPVLAAALLVLLTGCSEASSEEASADFCGAAEQWRAELVAFGDAVAGDAPVGDVRERAEAVEDAYEAALDAGEELEAARSEEVEAARAAFEGAVDDIDDDAPLSEAAVELQAAAADYQEQVAAAQGSVGCDEA